MPHGAENRDHGGLLGNRNVITRFEENIIRRAFELLERYDLDDDSPISHPGSHLFQCLDLEL
jgi:hypothetical protein